MDDVKTQLEATREAEGTASPPGLIDADEVGLDKLAGWIMSHGAEPGADPGDEWRVRDRPLGPTPAVQNMGS